MVRHRHGNGQLKSLTLTPDQAIQRAAKTEVRRAISLEHAKTRGMAIVCLQVLQRGFWGRLRWLLTGK